MARDSSPAVGVKVTPLRGSNRGFNVAQCAVDDVSG